jgi:hypothetical protein
MALHKMACAIAVLFVLLGSSVVFAAEMTIDFSWNGIVFCAGSGTSPAFQVRNAPVNTHSLSFTLDQVDDASEYGGSVVAYPAHGNVPKGAVYANGPCQPGNYRWTVSALDGAGKVLATASMARQLPN